jgi:hypothetical protein
MVIGGYAGKWWMKMWFIFRPAQFIVSWTDTICCTDGNEAV